MAKRYDRVSTSPKPSRERVRKDAESSRQGATPARGATMGARPYGMPVDESDRAAAVWRHSFSSEGVTAWDSAESLSETNAFMDARQNSESKHSHDADVGTSSLSTPMSTNRYRTNPTERTSMSAQSSGITKRAPNQQMYRPQRVGGAGVRGGAGGPGTVVLHPMQAEPDDYLHIPDKNPNAHSWKPTLRGCVNVSTIFIIALALLMLFVGYPILANYQHEFNKGVDGFVPDAKSDPIPVRGLIDPATAEEFYVRESPQDHSKWDLVFSDEFNDDGRTFWPGDDPYWEAGNFYYKATFDYEWYTPEAITTKEGMLLITLDEYVERLNLFRSGMLQSWNKFCFQGGYIEASVLLPGTTDMQGFWPGFWLMGNLGRPGYLGSTDGLWPYSYEGCDVGIRPFQKYANLDGPDAAINVVSQGTKHPNISNLPGMRFPSCTCSGQDHPGPNRKTARSAPELDIFEIQVQGDESHASQSFQVAPFDADYRWWSNSSSYKIYDSDLTKRNPWSGGPTQQALSCVTTVPEKAFFNSSSHQFTKFGVEYMPDFENKGTGYITWYLDDKPAWTLYDGALSPNKETKIGKRIFPKEPMHIIINLGISKGFQRIDWENIKFPAHMGFDYVRVYQKQGEERRVSCNPDNYPTADYIKRNMDLYTNNNYTVYSNASRFNGWPKNSYMDNC